MAAQQLLQSLATLYVRGVKVDWGAMTARHIPRGFADLPLATQVFWFDAPPDGRRSLHRAPMPRGAFESGSERDE